jgi:AhpC/TSA family
MMKNLIFVLLISIILSLSLQAAEAKRAVVVYDDKATEVKASFAPSNKPEDLWISLADLKASTGFENKPQGVCRAEQCFPLPKKRRAEFLKSEGKTSWFNLTEFARLVKQPVARDVELSTWYFGVRSEVQNTFTANLMAPEFTLPDKDGKLHSLKDFRGKKVLIVTWASW